MRSGWRSSRRARTCLLLVLACAAGLSGCGDDSDTTETGQDEPTATTAVATATTVAAQAQQYCAASLRIETAPEPDIDFRTATPEQMKEAARKAVAETYRPLALEVQRVAPPEVKPDIDTLVAAVEEVGRSGDFEAVFERPDVARAEERAHAFDLRTCGWVKSDIDAVEYAFQGAPSTLKAGVHSLELSNKGKEPHELVLVRINDDVKESLADLVKLPEEEAKKKVTDVGGTFAESGKSGYKIGELKPGRYGMVCFVPVGGGDQGPPHASRGMFAEVKVT